MSVRPIGELDAEQWLEAHGDALYRYALHRTGNPDTAEDLVQETLLAAWRGRDSYQGGSSERTWLTGILRHKIADHLRRGSRQDAMKRDLRDEGSIEDALFKGDGAWRAPPTHWGDDPLALNEAEAFASAISDCLDELSPTQRASFTLREFEDVGVDEASRTLGITANNLYVLLHRARLAIRRCLEVHWFGGHRRP